MTRVAISGTHHVGKSALIARLSETTPNIQVIGNIMRGIAQDGYGVGARSTPSTFAVYLERQLEQEHAAAACDHWVSDRIFVDGVAYVLAAIETGIATFSWSSESLLMLKAVARLHAARYDYHVIIPVEFSSQLDDPINPEGEDFQQSVDEHLRRLVHDKWPSTVVEVHGTVEQRLEKILSLFEFRSAKAMSARAF